MAKKELKNMSIEELRAALDSAIEQYKVSREEIELELEARYVQENLEEKRITILNHIISNYTSENLKTVASKKELVDKLPVEVVEYISFLITGKNVSCDGGINLNRNLWGNLVVGK